MALYTIHKECPFFLAAEAAVMSAGSVLGQPYSHETLKTFSQGLIDCQYGLMWEEEDALALGLHRRLVEVVPNGDYLAMSREMICWTQPRYFQDLSRAANRVVQIPVLLTGGVTTPAQAEELLEEGCADLIGVGRAIYRNPHWAD